jgi:hypothetical protein
MAEMVAYFSFMDMVGEGIGDQIVLEIFDIVFGRRFCPRSRVSRYSEDGRLSV